MLVIYTPDGGDRKEFEFKPDEAWSFEAELIESVGRPTWVSYDTDFQDLLRASNFKARRALLWVLLKREDPNLRFSDLVVKVNEIQLGLDKDERADLRRRLDSDEFTAAERSTVEGVLAAYDDSEDAEPEEAADLGKDEPAASDTGTP